MTLLLQLIYNQLLEIAENVSFNMLPVDIDPTQLYVIYEVSESDSRNAMDLKNYASTLNLVIKLFHSDSLVLIDKGEEIKQQLLNVNDINYKTSIPIFQDPDLGMDQLTLSFEIENYAGVAGLAIARRLTGYSVEELQSGLTQLQKDGLAIGKTLAEYTEIELESGLTADQIAALQLYKALFSYTSAELQTGLTNDQKNSLQLYKALAEYTISELENGLTPEQIAGLQTEPVNTVPAQVTGLTATATAYNTINLAWIAPNNGGAQITVYQIERRISGGVFSVLVANNAGLTYSDNTALELSTYDYRISAINAVGTGEASAIASATTPAQPQIISLYTEAEKATWVERAANGPYKTAGDVGANTPGDWERITAAAASFLADPSADRFTTFYQGAGAVPRFPDHGDTDPYHEGTDMHDAAFYYLVTNNADYGNAVKNELLTYIIREPFLDFSNRELWTVESYNAVNPVFFTLGSFIAKCIHSYDYTKDLFTEAEKIEVEQYFSDAGNYANELIENDLSTRFVNSDPSGELQISQIKYSSVHEGTDNEYTHAGGYQQLYIGDFFNNRYAEIVKTMALVGVMNNNVILKEAAKTYFKNWLRFGVFPDGTPSERFRASETYKEQGYIYAVTNTTLMCEIAYLFHIVGDNELFDYETRDGILSSLVDPADPPKSLLSVMKNQANRVESRNNPTLKVYIHNHLNDEVYAIDGVQEIGSLAYRIQEEKDIQMCIANRYYQDAYIEKIITRTHINCEPLDANPNSGVQAYKGTYWGHPGILFMYGYEQLTTPQNLTISDVIETSFTVSWEASTNPFGNPVEYEVYIDDVLEITTTDLIYYATGKTDLTTYSIKVRAIDNAGNASTLTDSVEANTAPIDIIDPIAATNIRTNFITFNGVGLLWDAATDNIEVVGYNVYLNGVKKNTEPITGLSYGAYSLDASTDYSVTIEAFDAENNAAMSAPFDVRIKTAPPRTLTEGVKTSNSITVNWIQPNANVKTRGYIVNIDGVDMPEVTVLTYEATDLTPSTAYTFNVKAVDIDGVASDFINELIISTEASGGLSPENKELVTFESAVFAAETTKYYKYEPEGMAEAADGSLPCFIMLHGLGEFRDKSAGTEAQKDALIWKLGMAKHIQNGDDLAALGIAGNVVYCPQQPYGTNFGNTLSADRWNDAYLLEVYNIAIANPKVNPNKVVIAGLSMGAMGALRFASQNPEKVSKVIAVCPNVGFATLSVFETKPLWIVHGEADTTAGGFGSGTSNSFVNDVKTAYPAAPIKYTRPTGVGHDTWTKTFNSVGWPLAELSADVNGNGIDEIGNSTNNNIYDWAKS